MKAVHCVVCAFFVICALDITRGKDFSEIWTNLPHDFGNFVTNTWNSILKAIRSPVEVRRLGRNKRKKTTTTSTTTESYEIIATSHTFSTEVPKRPTIPIISQPKWRSLLDWRILQKPNLVKLAQEFSNRVEPPIYGREINSYEGTTTMKLTTYDEESHFENLGTIHAEEKEEQGKIINIPILPTPKYKYDYLWQSKYTRQYFKDPYSTEKPASRLLSADETLSNFHSSQDITVTEETGALMKELKFGKYRLKIFYKLFFN